MRTGRIVGILLGSFAVLAGLAYFFWPDTAKYLGLRRQQRFLNERVKEEEAKTAYLKAEQEALAQNPVQIERVAREKLGYSKPGEIIYKFEEEEKDVAAVPSKEAHPKK